MCLNSLTCITKGTNATFGQEHNGVLMLCLWNTKILFYCWDVKRRKEKGGGGSLIGDSLGKDFNDAI